MTPPRRASIIRTTLCRAVVTRRREFLSGIQSGDVAADLAIVWARADRPSRMWVEWSTTPSFAQARRLRGPHVLEGTDRAKRWPVPKATCRAVASRRSSG